MAGEGRVIDNLMNGDLVVERDIVTGRNYKATGPQKERRYARIDFQAAAHPIFKGKVLANGSTFAHAAPTGATGDENVMIYPEGTLEYHILGTQTLLAPLPVATGLEVSLDDTDDDGVEFCAGILASNKLAFVVGTDPAFYAKLKFSVAVVAGSDDCAFGFRKAEDYQANLDDYDEMAVLNSIDGTINMETILNGGGTTTTDTTDDWADAETHELEVRVSAAGVVTYRIDGRPVTVAAAFTFDDAEVVVPFFFILNDATTFDSCILKSFECGYQ